jgi:hypothetical protein
MKTNKQQQVKSADPTNKPTKKYDKVTTKIRKLLGATAQTFIPELCQALKDDWFPTMSEKDLQNNKGIRDAIRERIFEDWSSERGIYSQDNIWSDATINNWLPTWLRNPIQQESNKENLRKATEIRKIQLKSSISEREKQKLDQIAEDLPDSVIVPDREEETEDEKEQWNQTFQELGVAPYGETGKSTRQLTGAISESAYKLFAALTNNDTPPTKSSDLLVDYIRPTREFRRGLMLEVDPSRRAAIHNALHYASVAIEDMIEIIREIDKDN